MSALGVERTKSKQGAKSAFDIDGPEIPQCSAVVCAIVWVAAQEGSAAPHEIQNDSGLAQGLAAPSAAD